MENRQDNQLANLLVNLADSQQDNRQGNLRHVQLLYRLRYQQIQLVYPQVFLRCNPPVNQVEDHLGSQQDNRRDSQHANLRDSQLQNLLQEKLDSLSFRHRHRLVNHLGKLMYNQIDYILVPQQLALRRHLLINARSYGNQSFESDHKVVIAEMDLTAQYKRPRDVSKGNCKRYDSRLLNSLDPKYRENFQAEMERVTSALSAAIDSPGAPSRVYKSLVKAYDLYLYFTFYIRNKNSLKT